MSLSPDKFHQSTIVMDCHQEILDEYVYEFLANEEAVTNGEKCVFDEIYLPYLKKQGTNFVNLSVGGDHVAQVMYSASEFRFWDAHKKLDSLNSEFEAGCLSFIICRNNGDIDLAIKENKVGILATISGGRPLMGKPNLNLLSSLRSLYRMGLRGLQLTGNGRNRLGDGVSQNRSRGQLTSFGENVVKEADRLGMVIDTAQLSDAGFYDLISITKNPVIDSHSCAQAVCPHPRNIDDQRIKAIAERGGVIAVSFWASLVNQEKDVPDVEDLIRHIDHIVNLVGINHVALGPDYCAYQTPVDRDIIKGFSNLGPDFGEFNRLTPVLSEKYPGYVEGIWYGIRKSDFISGPENHESFSGITESLLSHGVSETECQKILGSNMLNVYREVLH
jgi:membrane dipeptidase